MISPRLLLRVTKTKLKPKKANKRILLWRRLKSARI